MVADEEEDFPLIFLCFAAGTKKNALEILSGEKSGGNVTYFYR